MQISRLGLRDDSLKGETVVVTGSGGGIGFEAARSLARLGACVVIAEIDPDTGSRAEEALAGEFGDGRARFIRTDVGDETSVERLRDEAFGLFGKVDAVINNATIVPVGKVEELPIEEWDRSYRVNLRGPVLMAKAFLPAMVARDHGVFVCVSSVGAAFLGCYEAFKTAQAQLAGTLDAELEGSRVVALTIGPGFVPTETLRKCAEVLAPRMGMSVEAFFELNKDAALTPEEAGAGFAAAIALADRFRGQEISSIQALRAADLSFGSRESEGAAGIGAESRAKALTLCSATLKTLREQSEGWRTRSVFERQWVLRDFRKTAGMSVEEWISALGSLEAELRGEGAFHRPPLERLAGYYEHLAELAKGYEKDPTRLEESLRSVYAMRDEAAGLAKAI